MRTRATTMAALAILGGCAAEQAQTAALRPYPGIAQQIADAYDGNAVEQGGRCEATTMGAITAAEVVREDATRITFEVRYQFQQAGLNAATAECEGFASRRFTFDKLPDGLALMEMGGAQGGD